MVDNIYKIDVHLPKSPLRTLNSYLVKGDKQVLLTQEVQNSIQETSDLSLNMRKYPKKRVPLYLAGYIPKALWKNLLKRQRKWINTSKIVKFRLITEIVFLLTAIPTLWSGV